MTRSSSSSTRFTLIRVAILSVFCIGLGAIGLADASLSLGSKTPYSPQQDPSTYEAPPNGFTPVFTQIVARHGSRGLSSPSNDLALYAMWLNAQASGNLTRLGGRLGADLQRIIRANALLGYGVNGITAPGYGNLTKTGIMEHMRLARRLASRVSPLLSNAVDNAQTTHREVIVSTSGVNRAVDSANFFVESLTAAVPGLAPLVVSSQPLTAYPVNKPVAQAAGVNRFQLYFHKLAAKTDLPAADDPYYAVYQSSLEYQRYLASDPTMLNKVNSIVYSPASQATARAVLESIFTKSFIDTLDNGSSSYSNTGTFTFTSDDGKFTTSVQGDGETTIANVVDAANALYAVYSITPSMTHEINVDMAKYFKPRQLAVLGYLSDAQDFYEKGPGIKEAAPVTYIMSQALLDDFFHESDAIAAGDAAHAAKLRFTHAEIIIPFAERLGLPDASAAVAADHTYTYRNNPWRGEQIAPLAANVQWDLFTNGSTLLVRMYYNEKETDFPAACDSARYAPDSRPRRRPSRVRTHFYEYTGLKACYGY